MSDSTVSTVFVIPGDPSADAPIVSGTDAVASLVASIGTESAVTDAMRADGEAFIAAALAVHYSIGSPIPGYVDNGKRGRKADKVTTAWIARQDGVTYKATRVFHVSLVGKVLAAFLGDSLPDGVSPRDLLGLVTKVNADDLADIMATADDLAAAYLAMVTASQRKVKTPVAETGGDDETDSAGDDAPSARTTSDVALAIQAVTRALGSTDHDVVEVSALVDLVAALAASVAISTAESIPALV